PMEDGPIVGTAWAALAVRDYAPAGRERERADSQRRSAQWLATQQPATHNDAVFQLLGVHWSNAKPNEEIVARVVRTQRADGGWSQLPGIDSDAWATGTALYALHEAGGMAATDPVYQRGVAFLLRTQFEDGSWWVKSRTWAFQPHFDGQFPHGKDQWISQGAAGWATLALLPTLESVAAKTPAPSVEQLLGAHASATAMRAAKAQGATATVATKVDFTRDVQPLLERSCAGCHGGEKPRAGFVATSRAGLVKGGQSGEPAFVSGNADGSNLIKYVSDKIEDLEMPPLDRREKYPALSASEVALLRAWIDAGAP
ncbi:MAG: c-type cytochrome domain-containing protein, partial [Opitutaceae bacterium]